MTYAQIDNDKVVNIISAEEHGAKSLFKLGFVLVPTNKPIAIGDTFDGITFYRDGIEVLTEQEVEIATLKEALNIVGVQTEEKEVTTDAE